MKTLGWVLSSAAVSAIAGLLVACFPENWSEELEAESSNVELVDPLEGAYVKQGGTAVNFVFKRGETRDDPDTFIGEIETQTGDFERASGTARVGRDDLGTTLTLKMDGEVSTARPDGGTSDGGTPVDTRPVSEQAFNGTMHFLRIGKNQTLLVRAEANGKTGQYRKVKSWCREDSDCSPDVQKTGLECAAPKCTTRGTCACD